MASEAGNRTGRGRGLGSVRRLQPRQQQWGGGRPGLFFNSPLWKGSVKMKPKLKFLQEEVGHAWARAPKGGGASFSDEFRGGVL